MADKNDKLEVNLLHHRALITATRQKQLWDICERFIDRNGITVYTEFDAEPAVAAALADKVCDAVGYCERPKGERPEGIREPTPLLANSELIMVQLEVLGETLTSLLVEFMKRESLEWGSPMRTSRQAQESIGGVVGFLNSIHPHEQKSLDRFVKYLRVMSAATKILFEDDE